MLTGWIKTHFTQQLPILQAVLVFMELHSILQFGRMVTTSWSNQCCRCLGWYH